MKNVKKFKGFTLVELMVTIAIITVLSGILVISVSGFVEQANNVADATNVKNIVTLLESEALLSDDLMISMTNPTGKDASEAQPYILVKNNCIRVANEEVAKILAEAGYIVFENGREYQNQDGSYKNIEYQYFTSNTTIRGSTNKDDKNKYWDAKEEIVKEDVTQSANFHCQSTKKWTRYSISWKLGDDGYLEFYVHASNKTYSSTGIEDAEASKALSELCGVQPDLSSTKISN